MYLQNLHVLIIMTSIFLNKMEEVVMELAQVKVPA